MNALISGLSLSDARFPNICSSPVLAFWHNYIIQTLFRLKQEKSELCLKVKKYQGPYRLHMMSPKYSSIAQTLIQMRKSLKKTRKWTMQRSPQKLSQVLQASSIKNSPFVLDGCCNNYPWWVCFIIGNEFCERYAYYGMRAVLVLYLNQFIGFSKGN